MSETMSRHGGPRDEVIGLLRAYADARLSPDPAAAARTRARVMREARLAFDAGTGEADSAPSAAADPDAPTAGAVMVAFAPRRPHRVATALLAATLAVLALAGGTLAARPGGPLYGARVWVESVFLPADPGRRIESELRRLDERLAEARDAAVSGNHAAEVAALNAYRAIVDDAISAAGADPALQDRIETALGHHIDVLQGLLETVPAAARDAISEAIERSGAAVDRIGGPDGHGVPAGGQGDKPLPGTTDKPKPPKPTAKPGSAATPAPPSPAPTAAPTPESTPKATPDRPSRTDAPNATPAASEVDAPAPSPRR